MLWLTYLSAIEAAALRFRTYNNGVCHVMKIVVTEMILCCWNDPKLLKWPCVAEMILCCWNDHVWNDPVAEMILCWSNGPMLLNWPCVTEWSYVAEMTLCSWMIMLLKWPCVAEMTLCCWNDPVWLNDHVAEVTLYGWNDPVLLKRSCVTEMTLCCWNDPGRRIWTDVWLHHLDASDDRAYTFGLSHLLPSVSVCFATSLSPRLVFLT